MACPCITVYVCIYTPTICERQRSSKLGHMQAFSVQFSAGFNSQQFNTAQACAATITRGHHMHGVDMGKSVSA